MPDPPVEVCCGPCTPGFVGASTTSVVSGLSAPIVVTLAQLLSMSWSLRPEERERKDDTVGVTLPASSYEVTTLRSRAAVGRHQGVRPASHLEGTCRTNVEGGSGRSEASPATILQDAHSVEGSLQYHLDLICLVALLLARFTRLFEHLCEVFASVRATSSVRQIDSHK